MKRKLLLLFFIAFCILICSSLTVYADENIGGQAPQNEQEQMQQTVASQESTVKQEQPVESKSHQSITRTLQNGWVNNTDGTKSYYVDGVPVTGDYVIEGRHYYFNKDGIQQTGFFYVGDKKYFYDDYRKTGWQKINGYTYYFNPEMKTGLQTIDGKKYYLKNSVIIGLVEINGSTYFFKNHMRTGVYRINGRLHYFLTNGKAITSANKWIRYGNTYKYAIGNGVVASGVKKIGSSLYLFASKTGNRVSQGFYKYNNYTYYCLNSGKLAKGWQSINNYAYYFGKTTGKMARNRYIGHLYVPSSGRLGHSYARGIRVLNKNGWSLYSAYQYSYRLKYANRWMRRDASEIYANYGFLNGCGNCYVMAGTFYVQAKLLGYCIRQIHGRVGLPHSWTEIRLDGKWWVFDPNFRNETGRSGWKIYYGKSGTWRYNSYTVFQRKNKTTI